MTVKPGKYSAPLLACVLWLALPETSPALAQPTGNADDAPSLTAKTFEDPPLSVRPLYRWWLPLAATEDAQLVRELDEMRAAGAGGVEVVPMPVPGADLHFLSQYGFGTPAWRDRLTTLYRAANARGMQIDISAAASWPTSLPTTSRLNDPAAQQQLIFAAEQVQPGVTRAGRLPTAAAPRFDTRLCAAAAGGELRVASATGYGVGDVIAVGEGDAAEQTTITGIGPNTLAACDATGASSDVLSVAPVLTRTHDAGAMVSAEANRTLLAVVAAQCATANCPATGGTRLLAAESVRDLTRLVDGAGALRWTAPEGGQPWWLIAFYQTADGQALTGLTATSPNYVLDHLGQAGAAALAHFYDAAVLTPQLSRLIRAAGKSALFEDSYEPSANLKWTWNFADEFARRRGYALTPVLPVLAGGGVGARRGSFDFSGTLGERVREDYRQTWSDLYRENHLDAYGRFAHERGLRTRMQIEGGPMQVADLSAFVDTPEGENRNFLNNPELWKVIGSGAQMRAREAVLSTECCPVHGGVWATTAGGPPYTVAQGTGAPFAMAGNNANLNWIYKAYAGGVSQLVWHGFPYLTAPEGSGDRAFWPGNTFDGNTQFAEAFGPRMPQWEDYRGVNDHIARLQLVLRQGRPRYDVAVFWHDFGVPGIAPNVTAFTGYPGLSHLFSTTSSLAGAGFTYQYLSPLYLDAASSRDVRDGQLFADRIGFRAIVLNAQEVMPLASLRRVHELVREAHFPLVIVGATPRRVPGARAIAAEDAQLAALIADLRRLAETPGEKVAFVDTEGELPEALLRLGVEPAVARVSHPASSDILAVRRSTADADFYFLFNQSTTPAVQTISLAGRGAPFLLDTWSGQVEPLALYDTAPGRVTLPVRIGANDVAVIAISRQALAGMRAPRLHATQTNAADARVAAGHLYLRAMQAGAVSATLSDGRRVEMSVSGIPEPLRLNDWRLAIESWTPDETKRPGLEHTRRTRLAPLAVTANAAGGLPGWTAFDQGDKAGLGFYAASFDLPASWGPGLGAHLNLGQVVDTFRVTVNGSRLLPTNLQDTSAIAVGEHLRPGRNVIEVRVATPLRNAVETATHAGAPLLKGTGLIGPVTLTFYRDVRVGGAQSIAGTSTDPLLSGFVSPPNSAQPRVWWHWMNGNVTQDGIKADLEWMHRVGIGGAHYFDAGGPLASYAVTTPRLVIGDPNWRAAIRLAAATADRLGMEFTAAAASGWSETGGPWVTPAQAMKKYVWSELLVQGGRSFRGKLPQPPDVTGPFQNVSRGPQGDAGPPRFYADSRVFAYRLPEAEQAGPLSAAEITSSGGPLEVGKLTDGDIQQGIGITAAVAGELPWIQYKFSRPERIRGLRVGLAGTFPSGAASTLALQVSDDGQSWRAGASLTGAAAAPLKTYSFAPLEARYFRLSLQAAPPPDMSFLGMPSPPPATGRMRVTVTELSLERSAVVDRFAEKAVFTDPLDYGALASAPADSAGTIRKSDVVDLTARMQPDGTIEWTPPAGHWRVVRLGYSLVGTTNHPAPREATGLEVDKFSRSSVKSYLGEYLKRFEAATGPDLIGAHGLQNLLSDSWEAGVQNWTDDMPAEFERRRGYEMTPWLPVLTGRVVETAAASDKFLWDFRRTLQDLLSQHYAVLAEEAHAHGMKLYGEAQGDTWRAMGDGMEIKRHADIPMAEYWFRSFAAGPGQPTLKTDMKESASVASIYGKTLVANESLTVFGRTDPWSVSPAMLRPVLDEIFAYGVNRIVIHTSVHQPFSGKAPGLTLGPFGQHFNRNETWAEQAGPFVDYISRSSFLLQQGRRVADVAYFYGEEKPLVALFAGHFDTASGRYLIEVPDGYDYDFVNAEALREEFRVDSGTLATRSGMSYRVLYVPPHVTAMTLPTLQKLRDLVADGAVLSGSPPVQTLGLTASDAETASVAAQIWGAEPGRAGMRTVGRGKVYWGRSLAEVLTSEQISPDVRFENAQSGSHVMSVHRRTAQGADVYFLTNRLDRAEHLEAGFRVVGKRPELWHADTGQTEQASYRIVDGRTVVPLDLAATDSVFIVFREPTSQTAHAVPTATLRTLMTLSGPYELSFPPDRGAPTHVTLPALTSWSEHEDPGVRYFSGTATYTKAVEVPRSWFAGDSRLLLDLGSVREVAGISVNDKPLGVLWKLPYEIDVTDALKPGRNILRIAVTNLWPNRLIGDAQPGAPRKYTWTVADALSNSTGPDSFASSFLVGRWSASSKLLPSGLLGPVTIRRREVRPAPAEAR